MNRVDSLVRQWCQNALKKKLVAMCADEEPAASADDETCAVLLSEIALLLRNGSWVQSLETVLVHTFLRQRLTLAMWHRLATADGVLQSISERRDRRARSDCWFAEGQGRPPDCVLYWWSLSVAKSASSSVLTNCFSVARAARDMAVSRAQSIGPVLSTTTMHLGTRYGRCCVPI
jgi:hypothetical protein